MNTIKAARLSPVSAIMALLPLGLWAMLWLSLMSGPGNIQGIIHPGSPMGFFHGLRAISHIAAAAFAIPIILTGVSRQGPRSYLLFGPLGLAAVYGLVGLASFLLSPDKLVALYWAAAYLSVPLVLWAIVRGANTTGQLRHIINFNWLIVILGASVLLAVAPRYLHLGSLASDPSPLLECELGERWFKVFGVLRATGVGRFAAVAGLIALAGLWRGSWRPLWGLVLVGSLALLLTTGARTAFFGFAVAAVFVVLLYEGKRAAVAGSAALIVLVPLAWGTGVHQPFLNKCILRGWADLSPAASELPVPVHVPPGEPAPARVSPQEQPAVDSPAPGGIPKGFFTFTGRTVVWEEAWDLFTRSPLEAPSAQVSPPPLEAPSAQVSPPPLEAPSAQVSPPSPAVVWALGFGFHADRLKLGQHMHNSFLHAMIQTGLAGTIPLVAAILLGWVLLVKALRNLARLPVLDKHLVIQTGGILAFFTIRSVWESTGAFFGVDWLLLAPLLLYLQVVNRRQATGGEV